MTEQEWLACTDPTPMLEFLRSKTSDRKLRLLVCAVCRRIWQHLSDSRSRDAVLLAERLADGAATFAECVKATAAAHDAAHAGWDGEYEQHDFAATVARYSLSSEIPLGFVMKLAAAAAYKSGPTDEFPLVRRRVVAAQVVPLRDIFGNPFRPVGIEPAWLLWNNGMVAKIAETIYDDCAFDRMPILADTLQEAGCETSTSSTIAASPESMQWAAGSSICYSAKNDYDAKENRY